VRLSCVLHFLLFPFIVRFLLMYVFHVILFYFYLLLVSLSSPFPASFHILFCPSSFFSSASLSYQGYTFHFHTITTNAVLFPSASISSSLLIFLHLKSLQPSFFSLVVRHRSSFSFLIFLCLSANLSILFLSPCIVYSGRKPPIPPLSLPQLYSTQNGRLPVCCPPSCRGMNQIPGGGEGRSGGGEGRSEGGERRSEGGEGEE
jgi:hypothetical protein